MASPPRNDRLVKELNAKQFQGIVVSNTYQAGGVACVDVYVPKERRILEKVPAADVVGRDKSEEELSVINLEKKSLARIVSEMLREYAMRPCLGVKEQSAWVWYSYSDTKQRLSSLSSYLGATCPPHAYVCVIAENSLNYIVILLACMTLGLTAVPLSMNFRLADYETILAELLQRGPIGAVITSQQDVLDFFKATRPTLAVLHINDPKLFPDEHTATELLVASPPCPAPHSTINETFMRREGVSPHYGWKCHQCSVPGMGDRWACPSCPCSYCFSCKPVCDPDQAFVGVLNDSTLLVRVSSQTGTGRYLHKNVLGTCTYESKDGHVVLQLASLRLEGREGCGEINGEDFKLVRVSRGGGRSLEMKCFNGHALVHRVINSKDKTPGYAVFFKCDLCDASIQQSEVGCSACDYDVCRRCLKNGKCPAGHPMIKSAVIGASDRDPQLVCDECNSRIDGSLYSCVVCDYDRCDACKTTRDTAAFVLYTSGSSGMAKGAVIREDTFLSEIAVVEGNYSPTGATGVNILNSPISVSSSPYTLLIVLLRGGRLAITSAKENGFEIYKEVAPTSLGLVPQIWGLLYKAYQADPAPKEMKDERYKGMLGHRLVSINCGGARPNREVMAWLKQLFSQCRVTENYAATETGPITFGVTSEGWTTLLPGIKYKLIRQTADKPYPKGELCVITPTMFSGYLNAKLPDVYTKDGYYRTEDIVEVDVKRSGQVCIRVIDRSSFMFKLANGEWCSPETIENTLMKSELVKQCFVHGDSHMDAVVCLVVLQEVVHPTRQEVLDDFHRLCTAANLRPCEAPAKVHLLPSTDSLPLTDTSKLARRKIRTQYQSVLHDLEGSDDGEAFLEDLTRLVTLTREPTDEESAEWAAVPWSSITAIQAQLLIKEKLHRDVSVALLLGKPPLAEVLKALGTASTVQHKVNEDAEIAKWSSGLCLTGSAAAPPTQRIVLVTGATGFLGGAVVRELVKDESVVQVYALTRREAKVEGKVVWVVGDLARKGLGIPQEVADQCNTIVHCGAEVNHMKDYAQLKEPNCGGTCEVLKIADGKHLCFVSSISVLDKDTSGYTTSKRVAEGVVRAVRGNAVVVRPGLLGPCSETGVCNANDWFVRGLRSSYRNKVYKVNPASEELWATPVDYAAKYLLRLLFEGSPGCYNIPTARTNLCKLYSAFEGLRECTAGEWHAHLDRVPTDDPMYPFKGSVRSGYTGCPSDPNEVHLPGMPPPAPIANAGAIQTYLSTL